MRHRRSTAQQVTTRRGGRPGPRDETGATAIEYALLASLVAAVIAGVVGALGVSILGFFDSVIGQF